MLEINLNNYNEMVRYEPAMDRLRALALSIVENGREIPKGISSLGSWQEDLYMLIKHFSRIFAEDIDENGRVTENAISRFSSAIATVERNLGITDFDIRIAREKQLYIGSGFWEMRRFLGQFADVAESLSVNPPDHIIAAGISGCVVAEYLGLKLEKDFGISVPVNHMVFSREGVMPVRGYLPLDFHLKGKNILLVEDAVEESRTLGVMIQTLRGLDTALEFDLFSLVIVNDSTTEDALKQMNKIYTFEE